MEFRRVLFRSRDGCSATRQAESERRFSFDLLTPCAASAQSVLFVAKMAGGIRRCRPTGAGLVGLRCVKVGKRSPALFARIRLRMAPARQKRASCKCLIRFIRVIRGEKLPGSEPQVFHREA